MGIRNRGGIYSDVPKVHVTKATHSCSLPSMESTSRAKFQTTKFHDVYTCMWQEIEHYFISYFDCVTVLEIL